jgi:hypothetical protein
MLERASTLRTVAPCLFTVVFGRLHIDASASASGSASHYGWLTSIAGAGEDRMIIFSALAMCYWSSMFGIASQSYVRAARSGCWESKGRIWRAARRDFKFRQRA